MMLGINQKKKKAAGFTLIELMIIVAIIVLLVTAILMSLHSAQTRAGDNSAFSSLKTAASSAYVCLLNGVRASGMSLSTPSDSSMPAICMSGGVPIDDSATWPPLAKNGWVYGDGSSSNGFFWCDMDTVSPSPCGALVNGVCGQSSESGNFCYFLKNDSREIWCNQEGCRKVGF